MAAENGDRDKPTGISRTREKLTLHTPKFSHQTPSHLLSPAFISSPSFFNHKKPTYTTYELRYRFHPTKPPSAHPPFSFHVFLGPIPADSGSDAWFSSSSRIGGHGISAGYEGRVRGTIPLTRTLLEKRGTLEAEAVLPYLRKELRWVVEKDDGAVTGLDLLPMFKVRVASAEVRTEELGPLAWVFYESVVDGMKGRLK